MNDIVISDTTALIILAKSDAFSLLSNLFQKIYIPKAVYDELVIGCNCYCTTKAD